MRNKKWGFVKEKQLKLLELWECHGKGGILGMAKWKRKMNIKLWVFDFAGTEIKKTIKSKESHHMACQYGERWILFFFKFESSKDKYMPGG